MVETNGMNGFEQYQNNPFSVKGSSFDPVPAGMKERVVKEDNSHKKKVMLVMPNHRWACGDENYTLWLIFPTQLCLLAAQLEDKYQVVVVDCIIDDLSEEEFAEIVKKEKPHVVGMSNFTHEYSKAGHKGVEIAKRVDPSIITFMGGVYVITSPQLAMENKYLDYAVIGEGEIVTQELLAHLFEDGPMPEKGVGCRQDGKMIIPPRADFIQDLNQLKYPAYHLIDFMKYATRYQRETVARPRSLPFARVCMTRGCPIGCTFCCVESISGGPTRYRSAEHMYGELEMLKNKYGVKFFIWDDDNLFMNKNRIKELLRLMIERKLNIEWLLEATAIFCMDEECVDLCAQSGCKYLNIAIESGNPRVLKEIIKKPINFEHAEKIIAKMKSVRIDVVSNFVIGSPGETYDEILDTIRYAEKIDIDYVKFFISTPFPKTKMFEMAKKLGYLDDSITFDEHQWSHGTFNTPYFRAKDVTILRAYEWDRINFGRPEKKQKIAQMIGVSLERLDEIRRTTRERANPEVTVEEQIAVQKKQGLRMNTFLTTKEKHEAELVLPVSSSPPENHADAP